MERRKFLKYNSMALGGMLFAPYVNSTSVFSNSGFVSNRPSVSDRKFISPVIEKTIKLVQEKITNPKLSEMFGNCFPNTLDTTIDFSMKDGKPDTFVITGDIKAMWLRDSAAQVWPYLKFVNEDKKLDLLIQGVLNRQAKCIKIDPYANAFNKEATGSQWASDKTEMKPELYERKWEIDSLCYPVRLLYQYWKTTNKNICFTEEWHESLKIIVETFKKQQRKRDRGDYSFMRKTEKATDTLSGNGYGNPVYPNGMIVSSFRPSDDATVFPFLIPSNYFASKTLMRIQEIASDVYHDQSLSRKARLFAGSVSLGLRNYARAEKPDFGKILAYEVDGFGNKLFMDDANVPSLLSLPYLDLMQKNDPLYINTRKFILSEQNPWFFHGRDFEGNGSPHTGVGKIEPISIIMRALTSTDEKEIKNCVDMLIKSQSDTGFMHESFSVDNPSNYSRSWFAWANSLFGELILNIADNHPLLLKTI